MHARAGIPGGGGVDLAHPLHGHRRRLGPAGGLLQRRGRGLGGGVDEIEGGEVPAAGQLAGIGQAEAGVFGASRAMATARSAIAASVAGRRSEAATEA